MTTTTSLTRGSASERQVSRTTTKPSNKVPKEAPAKRPLGRPRKDAISTKVNSKTNARKRAEYNALRVPEAKEPEVIRKQVNVKKAATKKLEKKVAGKSARPELVTYVTQEQLDKALKSRDEIINGLVRDLDVCVRTNNRLAIAVSEMQKADAVATVKRPSLIERLVSRRIR